MKFEVALNIILDINERFERAKKEIKSQDYFEMLHTSLAEVIRSLTKEQYEKFSELFRETLKRLDNEILVYCSKTYHEENQDYIKKYRRFKTNQQEIIEIENEQYDDFDDENYDNDEEDDNYKVKWIDNHKS